MKELFHVRTIGASQQDIENLLVVLQHGLPDAYTALLAETNGAEAAIHDTGGDCLCLWSTDQIISLNQDYQIARWLPDVLAIGDTGGRDAIMLDMHAAPEPGAWPVMRVGLGDLDRASFQTIAGTFQQWSEQEFRLVSQLRPVEVAYLLEKLCVDLGFCLPPDTIAQFQQTPPADIDAFTDAVFVAEGLDPHLADRHLRRRVRSVVADTFERRRAG